MEKNFNKLTDLIRVSSSKYSRDKMKLNNIKNVYILNNISTLNCLSITQIDSNICCSKNTGTFID